MQVHGTGESMVWAPLAICSGNALFRLAISELLQADGPQLWMGASPLLAIPPTPNRSLLLIATDDLPDQPIQELLAALKYRLGGSQLRVVLFLEDGIRSDQLRALVEAGVQAIGRLGAIDGPQLDLALQAARADGRYLDPLFMARLVHLPHRGVRLGCPEQLTLRDRQLLGLIAQGYNSQEMARELGVRPDTARRYLSQTYARIGIRDRAQALGWAVAHGLIKRQDLERVFRPPGPESAG